MSSRKSGDRNSCALPVALALIGALATIVAAVISNNDLLERILANTFQSTSIVEQAPEADSGGELPASDLDGPAVSEEQPPGASSEEQVTTDCVVTVDHALVPLLAEPDAFSQEVIRLEPGEYQTINYAETTFADQTLGWFQIETEGRTGWIKNDTWTISAKTDTCP